MIAIVSSPAATGGRLSRLAGIDVVKGVAILAMAAYHFSWDLSAEGLIAVDVGNNLGWKIFARLIAGTFLVLVGVNLVLSTRDGFRPAAYFRRLAILAAAAVLVSLGTYWFIPDAFVVFGILHAIALFSVLGLAFLGVPLWLTALIAAFCLAAPYFLANPAFDGLGWAWLGLAETPIRTVDYVPVFPWFGVTLVGVILGRVIVATGGGPLSRWTARDPVSRIFALAGRWSLPIYLVHQPILLGILTLVAPLIGPTPATIVERYGAQCLQACAASYEAPTCAAYCDCITGSLGKDDGLLAGVGANRLSDAERQRWEGYVNACRVQFLSLPGDGII